MAKTNLLSRGFTPVVGVWDSKSGQLVDQGRDQHGLISGKHCLAEGDWRSALVLDTHGTSSVLTVRPVREWLLDLSVLVAIETAILCLLALALLPYADCNPPSTSDKSTRWL